jgi:NADH dehydrogenase FAD-containing subunit
MSTGQPTRIVIVGAGYTGIWSNRFLQRRLKAMIRHGEVQITVICPKNYHSLHGFTAEALCGIVAVANRQNPLRLLMRNVRLIRGYAERIDTVGQEVFVKLVGGGNTIAVAYNHLVLANGSYDAMNKVPGLYQYGYSLKESGGVLATRNRIIKMLDYADVCDDTKQITESLCFVVAGGGFCGVEIAANLAEMLHSMRKLYPVLERHKPRVVIIHSGNNLIPELRPRFERLADYAMRELQKWGVEIKLNTRLVEVTPKSAVLSDGTSVPTCTIISTIGQRRIVLPGTEHFPRTKEGLLITDKFLHVDGEMNVWTGGDSAQVMHTNGSPCPGNALWAVMHGVWIGDNLGRAMQGKMPRKFNYRGIGHAASLGIGKGITELNGVQFTGWIAWLLRLSFCLYFMPSRRQAVRAMFDWIMLPILGRYQTSLEPADQRMLESK